MLMETGWDLPESGAHEDHRGHNTSKSLDQNLDKHWRNAVGHHFQPIFRGVDPILQVLVFMVVACNIVFGVGCSECNFMLSMLQYVLYLAFMCTQSKLSQHTQKLMSDFPGDICLATAQFFLNAKHTIYATCPNP
jgi:hypothetical protein